MNNFDCKMKSLESKFQQRMTIYEQLIKRLTTRAQILNTIIMKLKIDVKTKEEKISIYENSEKFNVHYNWINIAPEDIDSINSTINSKSKKFHTGTNQTNLMNSPKQQWVGDEEEPYRSQALETIKRTEDFVKRLEEFRLKCEKTNFKTTLRKMKNHKKSKSVKKKKKHKRSTFSTTESDKFHIDPKDAWIF